MTARIEMDAAGVRFYNAAGRDIFQPLPRLTPDQLARMPWHAREKYLSRLVAEGDARRPAELKHHHSARRAAARQATAELRAAAAEADAHATAAALTVELIRDLAGDPAVWAVIAEHALEVQADAVIDGDVLFARLLGRLAAVASELAALIPPVGLEEVE